MTYATKQLTKALQDLTSSGQGPTSAPGVIQAAEFQIPQEVESFLEKKQSYAEKTRDVSVGRY